MHSKTGEDASDSIEPEPEPEGEQMSNEQIKVQVIDRGRKCLYLRYTDPMTGKDIEKSSECTTRKDAVKAAGKWEAELREGRFKSPNRITWAEFRQRYDSDVVPGMQDTTALKVSGVFDAVERIVAPGKLSALTAERISHYVKVLRAEEVEIEERVPTVDAHGRKRVERRKKTVTVKRSESTIKGHLAVLKAALHWAQRVKLLHAVPSIEMPKRAKGSKMMKGRPITGEEFERMLAAVPKLFLTIDPTKESNPEVIERDKAAAEVKATPWRQFLLGLWWSGLRLEEAINLWWDADDGLSVDLSGRRPMLRIPAEHEKGHQDRLLPMAPELAKTLLAVPAAARIDRVFKLPYTRKDTVSKVVVRIGMLAGVKVNTNPQTGKVKYASAHDLRRSFGERWAARVMPQILMQLMRHESIETTMRFYVGRNAETAADVLWEAVKGDTSGDSHPDEKSGESSEVVMPQKRTREESNLQPTDPKSVALSN